LLKRFASEILSRKFLVPGNKRFVFVYHDISNPGDPQYSELYSTTVSQFRTQIELLASLFDLVPLETIVSRESNEKHMASITFDDGFLSVKENAMDYLLQRGIPFAVFLSYRAIKENYLDYGPEFSSLNRRFQQKVYMDEEDIADLASKGVLIGNHTYGHSNLSKCSLSELDHEMALNKRLLEELTGKEIEHLALPFGKREHYNDLVLERCYETGHRYVYSTNPSYFSSVNGGPVPRIGLTNQSLKELIFLLNRPFIKRVDI
jgi:peptidoglycan/xylan/chitin deacetylase (PgdA/CDA1 family)